jgi:hypothetical protein
MAETIIQAPDGTIVKFPDGTTDETIKSVMAKNYPPEQESQQQPAPQPVEQPETQEVAPSTQPTEPLDFTYNAGKAMQHIPAGAMDALTGFESENLSRGAAYARNAIISKGFQRNAPPMVAGMLFAPSRLLTGGAAYPKSLSATTAAIAGWLGSKWAGDDNPDAMANAIYSSYLGSGKVTPKASWFKTMRWELPKEVTALGATSTVAEITRRSLEAGELTAFDSWQDYAKTVGPAAAFGTVSAAVKSYGGKMTWYENEIAKLRQELAPIMGKEFDVTLGMVDEGRWAKIEQRIADSDPELFNRIQAVKGAQESGFEAIFGGIPHSTQVADDLSPYVGKLAKEEETLSKLTKANAEAQSALQQARTQGLSESDLLKLEQASVSSNMALVNQRARATYVKNTLAKAKGDPISLSEAQENFTNSVVEIKRGFGNAADVAYKNTGVPNTQAFIPTKDLARSAGASLRGRESTDTRAIVQLIKDAGGESGLISINNLRLLKGKIADLFAGSDPERRKAMEAIGAIAYRAVVKRSQVSVANVFGKDVSKKYNAANKWYSDTSTALNSNYINGMLKPQPTTTMLENVVKDVAAGRFQSYKDFEKAVKQIGKLSPDTGVLGAAALNRAVRDGMILTSTENGRFSVGKLINQLNSAANKGFKVERLGFGSAKQLNEMNAGFRSIKQGEVSPDMLDMFYGSKAVQNELLIGGNVRGLARKTAARYEFEAMVRQQTLRDGVGATAQNIESNVRRQGQLARAAELDLEAQQKIVTDMRSDPLHMALNRESVGIPRKITGGDKAIYNVFKDMLPDDINRVMTAMRRTRPDLANDVSKRVSADIFSEVFVPVSTKSGAIWRLDADAYRRIFNPTVFGRHGSGSVAKAVLDPTQYARLEESIPAFDRMAKYHRNGGGLNVSEDVKTVLGLSGAAALNRPGAMAAYRGIAGKLIDLAADGKYRLLSAMLIDKDIASGYTKFVTAGRGASNATDDLIVQRFALLLMNDKEMYNEAKVNQDDR